jgi:hypothetical protein
MPDKLTSTRVHDVFANQSSQMVPNQVVSGSRHTRRAQAYHQAGHSDRPLRVRGQ